MPQHPKGYDELDEKERRVYELIIAATNRPWAGYVTHDNLRDVGPKYAHDLEMASLSAKGSANRASTDLGKQQYEEIAAEYQAKADELRAALSELEPTTKRMSWTVY